MTLIPHRRSSDAEWWISLPTRAWDWIDRRQIDAHVVSAIILYGSIKITTWAMQFVNLHPDKPGLEVAAIISVVMLPWSGLQAAAIKFYFETRQKSYNTEAKP